ncbi:hypothetical protein [Duganella radicis]|uniref:Uncharacterized protein n=1 Tax=Duganella radicis TaxID=551988 RepID=A0A6L6PPH8_9BURK|nr:hypothetical protein [Duganella radicis]MTV40903.1 hypothetical protein [Duganella radicis]
MSKQEDEAALAAEKHRLIREGELLRIKVVHSKALVGQALQPDALFHGAVDHAIGMAQARLGGLLQPGGLSGFNYKALMPYALTIGSYIARKRLVKPALALVVLAGAGVAWLWRRHAPPRE